MPCRELCIHQREVVEKLFTMKGSIFPKALPVGLSCACLTMVLAIMAHGWGCNADKTSCDFGKLRSFQWLKDEDSLLRDNSAFSGFSFLVGFLVVFRTSQSYSRFWDGCTALNKMHAEWFDAASSLVAFTRGSKASEEDIMNFRNLLVRLFSLLGASACAEIEDCCGNGMDDIKAYQFPLLDVGSLDRQSLDYLFSCDSKTELIHGWIQHLTMDAVIKGIVCAPPPIVSRAFNELANGMVQFHDALKISWIPFPFPYAQTCDFLLVLHWGIIPFVICQWTTSPVMAFIFSFVQVFILWALSFIAAELENPFGADANDIDGLHMQIECNYRLLVLVHPGSNRLPFLTDGAEQFHECQSAQAHSKEEHREVFKRGVAEYTLSDSINMKSLYTVFLELPDDVSWARRSVSRGSQRERLSVSIETGRDGHRLSMKSRNSLVTAQAVCTPTAMPPPPRRCRLSVENATRPDGMLCAPTWCKPISIDDPKHSTGIINSETDFRSIPVSDSRMKPALPPLPLKEPEPPEISPRALLMHSPDTCK